MIPSPYTNSDYYTLFNIKKQYHINKEELKRNYYKLMESVDEKKMIKIVEGYGVMKDDLRRAEYFNSINKSNGYGYSNNNSVDSNTINNNNTNSNTHLEELLQLEEDIIHNDNLMVLKEKIDECRRNYNNPYYVERWKYLDSIERRYYENK